MKPARAYVTQTHSPAAAPLVNDQQILCADDISTAVQHAVHPQVWNSASVGDHRQSKS